jgi:hypothetical protein
LANPNAQYAVLAPAPRLLPRSASLNASEAEPCTGEQLSVSELAATLNGSYRIVKLAFENHGMAQCKLGGYPEIALLDVDARSIGNIAIEKISSATLTAELSQAPVQNAGIQTMPEVVLAPRSIAVFQVGWTSGPGCPTVASIKIAAPGTSRSFAVNRPLTVCAGHIQITALRTDQGAS